MWPLGAKRQSVGSIALSYLLLLVIKVNCLNIILIPGNADDRQSVPNLLKNLFGKVIVDRGYVSV